MYRIDEGVVRALFHEHGGDALMAGDLPHVLAAYTSKCGAPIVDCEIADQITAFAHENSALTIGVEEFLGMVRSLEQETESSTDEASNASLLFDTKPGSTSPDTTLESAPTESPSKHHSAFAPRTLLALTAPSRRTTALMSSTTSEPDVAGMTARSALIRKLARVNEQLDRLHSEHQLLLHDKEVRDEECASLKREIGALRRDLQRANSHERILEARVHELEADVESVTADRDAHSRNARQLDMRLKEQLASFLALEAQEAEHVSQLASLRATCQAYVNDLHGLRTTCNAQRDAMTSLERTVDELERVHLDAEQLQQEVDDSRKVHEQLEQELRTLRGMFDRPGLALADDLALEESTQTSCDEPVSDAGSVTEEPVSTTSPVPVTESTAEKQGVELGSTSSKEKFEGNLVDQEQSCEPPSSLSSLSAPSSEASDPSTPDNLCQNLSPSETPRVRCISSEESTITLPTPMMASSLVSPDTPRPRMVWTIAMHMALVMIGMWLGLWIYHFAMLMMPAYLYQSLLDKHWIEANALDDSLYMRSSTHAWFEHHFRQIS